MPSDRDLRPRSYSDPTGTVRGDSADPGKRSLTEQLPVRSASSASASGAVVDWRTSEPDPVDQEQMLRPFGSRRTSEASAAAHPANADPALRRGSLAHEAVPLPPSPGGSLAHEEALSIGESSAPSTRAPSPELAVVPAVPADPAHLQPQDDPDVHAEIHRDAVAPRVAAEPAATDDAPAAVAMPPAPRGATGSQASDYYKSASYLAAAFGTLVSAIGWILLRQYPLIQPVGQALASGLKNSLGAMDDHHKANRPKAAGQTISAVGQTVALAGVVTASKHPGASSLTGIRATGAGLNAIGMVSTGFGEGHGGNSAKAISNFVAAALNLVGLVGYTVEATDSVKPAFLALESVNNFNNSTTPIGGAVDDARKSKVAQPWRKDPKVVGQEIADIGFALSGIAATLNKIYLTLDKEAGTHDSDHLANLIMALGAVGMFLATVGYGFSMMAEAPKKKPVADVELAAVTHADPAP